MGIVADNIIYFVKEYLNTQKNLFEYDKTVFGKVVSINGTSVTIETNGSRMECGIKDGITIAVGDIVIVKIPNNNASRKYVDGKLKK